MNTRGYQLIFPASASRKIGRVLDGTEKRRQKIWNQYQNHLKHAKEEQEPDFRQAAESCAEDCLYHWKSMPNKYYIKTPHACAISMTEDIYRTYMQHILCEYELYGGIPVCSFYYLQSDAGMFFLNMEYTRDGKAFTASQKTQMPGESIRGVPFKFYAEKDQEAIEDKQTIAHLFGIYEEDRRAGSWFDLCDTWDHIWGDCEMGAEETVKALSEFLQFPVLFPLFPCEKAKLVKSNQRVERYTLADTRKTRGRRN